ncbi:MAG: type III pantothenate kinase [Dehalococcoidales bacterium]|nr:MAG: type III pantothenate kinase [Dehalococcoidales bacterium]
MLLTIDIGNTNVIFGVFEGEELRNTWRTATVINKMADEYAMFLLNAFQYKNLETSDITGIALCSTVPPLVVTFQEMLQRYFGILPLVVGPGVKTGVSIRFDNPREVGPDRIANTAAAHLLYKGPVIIVDLGTATTFDIVSREGEFIGGVIAPGLGHAAEALFARTAALPRVELVAPKQTIGANTIAGMQSGIVFGYVGLVEGILERIQRELGEKATVVATGGYAYVITPETTVIDTINPDITLIGLRAIYQINQTQSRQGGAKC